MSPADENNPKILGTAETGSTVQLFTDVACTTAIGSASSGATFASPGISVTVGDDTTTMFYATATDAAGNVSACSTSPITYEEVSDSDGDGLSGSDEALHGCDPNLVDTDADGLTDFQEVTIGSLCYDTDTDDDEFDDAFEAFWVGTATGGAATSLADTDLSQPWVSNQWAGYFIKITGGTGSTNPWCRIASNTADTLTTSCGLADGVAWPSGDPDGTSTYRIQKVGTDPADACADTTAIYDERGPLFSEPLSPWTFDVDDSGTVTGGDIFAIFPAWLAEVGDGDYDPRLDVNVDGKISGGDVFAIFPQWLVPCTDVVITIDATVAVDHRLSTGAHTSVQTVAVTGGPPDPPAVSVDNGGAASSAGWRAACSATGTGWTVEAEVWDVDSGTTETRTYAVNCST